jgi:hypothetical protein
MGMKNQVFCANLDELSPLCNMALQVILISASFSWRYAPVAWYERSALTLAAAPHIPPQPNP